MHSSRFLLLSMVLFVSVAAACGPDDAPVPEEQTDGGGGATVSACRGAVWFNFTNSTTVERTIKVAGEFRQADGRVISWEPRPVTIGPGFTVSVRDIMLVPSGGRVTFTATVTDSDAGTTSSERDFVLEGCRSECAARATASGVVLTCQQKP